MSFDWIRPWHEEGSTSVLISKSIKNKLMNRDSVVGQLSNIIGTGLYLTKSVDLLNYLSQNSKKFLNLSFYKYSRILKFVKLNERFSLIVSNQYIKNIMIQGKKDKAFSFFFKLWRLIKGKFGYEYSSFIYLANFFLLLRPLIGVRVFSKGAKKKKKRKFVRR